MVLLETVIALAEALETAKRDGLDPKLLFETLAKGSADSFALRNHGMKAMLPDIFPERAFSTEYAQKDLAYALALAADAGLKVRGAELIGTVLQEAIDAGSGDAYFPVIAKHIDRLHKGARICQELNHDHSLCRNTRPPAAAPSFTTTSFSRWRSRPTRSVRRCTSRASKALARLDESLAACGTDKSKILSAIVYITDIKQKGEMNRAWDEWVDMKNPPMRAGLGVEHPSEPPHIVEIVVTAAK